MTPDGGRAPREHERRGAPQRGVGGRPAGAASGTAPRSAARGIRWVPGPGLRLRRGGEGKGTPARGQRAPPRPEGQEAPLGRATRGPSA
jgi:hypothetical protein